MCRALNFQSVSSRPQHAHNTTVWPSRADNTSTELARSGGSISLERSVSPSTQGDPRCARTLPYTTAGGIVLGNQVGGGGGGWGWGCVNRVVIPLPSLSCRCLYTVCAWVALHFPHRVAACGARARVGEHRDVRRGSARGREPPPKPDRVQVHGVQWERRGWLAARGVFAYSCIVGFYAAPGYRTRQTAVRANLTPAVSRFGSGLYRYCISYNVRWAVRCMASACRAVSAVSCMARHRVTGLPAVPRPPASPPNSPPRASSRRVRADLRHGVQ